MTAATLVSIAVTPANPTIAKSATENFVATGTYSDTTTKVITTSVTWSSSDTTIATIAPTTGIATATTKTGSTTITATSGSGASAITGNTKLTVGVGPFVYAANTNGGSPAGTISAFTEGSAGDLTAVGTSAIAAGKNPLAVTTDPLGKYVYVINQIDQTVGEYAIGSDGSLSAISTGTVSLAASAFPRDVKVEPSGNYLYVTDQGLNQIEAFNIGADGSLTPNAGSPWTTHGGPYDIAISPNGQYLYVSRAITPAGDVTEFAINPDGSLTLTGPTGGTQAGDTPEGIAIAPNGQFLYVVNSGDDDVQMFSISPTDGTLTPGQTFGTNGKDSGTQRQRWRSRPTVITSS